MRTFLLAGTALLALGACGGDAPRDEAAQSYGVVAEIDSGAGSNRLQNISAFSSSGGAKSAPRPQAEPSPSGGQAGERPATGPMLAYRYNQSIEAPADAVDDISAAHQARCEASGFDQCVVVTSSANGLGETYARASLSLRATPEWIEAFFEDQTTDLNAFKAKLTSSNVYAEDLSTQIIDTDARLKAKITLRDRLQALLTDRPSELKDLLELERELARVQADIDASASVLAELRRRVAMSDLSLSYSAKTSAVSQSVWRPLGDALSDFFYNFASALGAIVTLLAILLPWIPIILGGGWLVGKGWRRWRRSKRETA